jgi:hypothetical protein
MADRITRRSEQIYTQPLSGRKVPEYEDLILQKDRQALGLRFSGYAAKQFCLQLDLSDQSWKGFNRLERNGQD